MKITSLEIASFMLAAKRALSIREITTSLQAIYPQADVDIKVIYQRVRCIARSNYAHCVIDKEGSCWRYQLLTMSDQFFKKNRAIKRYRPEYWDELQAQSEEDKQSDAEAKLFRVLKVLRQVNKTPRRASKSR